VTTAGLIDVIDHGGKRGRLAAARRSCNKDKPATFLRKRFNHGRQIQLIERKRGVGNIPEDKSYRTSLSKNINAEPPDTSNPNGKIHFPHARKVLCLFWGHELEREVLSVVHCELAIVSQDYLAINSHCRARPRLEEKIGCSAVDHFLEQVFEFLDSLHGKIASSLVL
jgi:hypothetical protein